MCVADNGRDAVGKGKEGTPVGDGLRLQKTKIRGDHERLVSSLKLDSG